MNEEEIKKLVKAGYLPSFNEDYLFKVKTVINNNKLVHSAIFINLKTRAISFEGTSDFKQELLDELLKIIGGVKC